MTTAKLHQLVLIFSTLALSWLGMQIVHETGHICAASLTGGAVERVILHPLAFSRTDVSPNPHPLIVTWSGPIFGIILPLVAFAVTRLLHFSGWPILRFFAGFCLIANGAYLGIGSFDRAGDAGDLLRHGTPIGLLWLFGLLTVPSGFYLWHRLGPHFGLGPKPLPISPRLAWLSFALLVIVSVAEFLLSPIPC